MLSRRVAIRCFKSKDLYWSGGNWHVNDDLGESIPSGFTSDVDETVLEGA